MLLLFAALLPIASAQAQFAFGKNKVQYAEFDWQVMETSHFRVYFYQEESEVARIAARIAEDAYGPMAARFNHEIRRKIPLIIYSSPSYFSETNVISGFIGESTGGFTEFLKGRVVVPFHGSYRDFEHVINHELVHVFQLSKMEHVQSRQHRVRGGQPPLWFTEGLAEFWSKGWDTQADMIVKDMVLNDRLPKISQMWRVRGSFFMYKLGESICTFIDSTYGPDKLALIYENWPKAGNLPEVIQLTLGESIDKLSAKWKYSLQKRYFPEIESLDLPKMTATKISPDGFCMKGVPISYANGDGHTEKVIYMANRLGYTGIYIKPRNGSKNDLRALVKGERSTDFESLHLVRSGIDANNHGSLVFSAKSKGSDRINVYDLEAEKVVAHYMSADLVSIRSPRFSHDEKSVVFSGVRKNGYSDIYVLTLEDGRFQRLTTDLYYDIDPTYSLDDRSILFSSDRDHYGRNGALNIFRLDLATEAVTQLTFGMFKDQQPEASDMGIFFSSNREGSFNLFLLDYEGVMTRQSTYVTGAFDPRVSPDGEHLLFTGYQDMTFHIYQMSLLPDPKPISNAMLVSRSDPWTPDRIDDTTFTKSSVKYDTDFSFDIAQSTIGFDPVFGTIGGFQAAMSDILGNKAYYFLISNTAQTKDDLLSSFNVGVTYINREKRLNWGVGVFHLFDEFFNERDQFFNERQAGVLGLLSYPISTFSRFDFITFARYDKKDRRFGLPIREGFITTYQLSYVFDNSLWEFSGPLEGRRYNFSVAYSYDVSGSRSYNRFAAVDVRHYFRLGRASSFAQRMYAFTSSGLEPQRQYLGGSWNFRGFDRREFYTRNILFASQELRFPLLDALIIGLPMGAIDFRFIRGALFFDVGSAWEDQFEQFLGSFGVGARLSLGGFVLLRFDFTRTTDFKTVSPHTDFDFFFGWNF